MKKSSLILIPLLILLAGCAGLKPENNADISIEEGKYVGNTNFNKIFVRLEKRYAIIDWIYIDKFPRQLFSDTLSFNDSFEGIAYGKHCKLVKMKNSLYVVNTDVLDDRLKFKVKEDEDFYNRFIDFYKNSATLAQDYSKFRDSTRDKPNGVSYLNIRLKLERDFEIHEKIKTMKYIDFVKELNSFQEALKLALKEQL